jgi:hypothetical protein
MNNNHHPRKEFDDQDKHYNERVPDINKEVSELIKKGGDKASINDLRKKYGDDKIFDMVQEAYFERLAAIRKRSIKFIKFFEQRYGMEGQPMHIILNKALKYKKKYNLSEEEFELFRQYYQKTMNMRNNVNKYDILVPNTNMAKVFGDPYTNTKIDVHEKDTRYVKEILDLYNYNRALWQKVILSSITYDEEADLQNLKVHYNMPYTNQNSEMSSFVHPVIAALFLPKIQRFEEYFLYTNLAYILKCKTLGEPITTYHSYLMLYNLVTDPTDIVCNADSPIKDILNRVLLQVALWKNVIRLRQKDGVYDTHNSFAAADFMVNVDNCKLSTYDAPDLMMIGDENVIIRRLLNSLAFRCATVYSIPALFPNIYSTTLNIPFNHTQITKVAMIYIRLPYTGMLNVPFPAAALPAVGLAGAAAPAAGAAAPGPQNIQSSLQNPQTTLFNGKLENRIVSVVGTDGVLIVSIPRRTYKALSGGIYNLPQVFNMSATPHHAFGLETLNNTTIKTNMMLSINNTVDAERYSGKLFLKSVVSLKEQSANNNTFIYGSKTYIFSHQNDTITVYDPIKNNTFGQRPIRQCNTAALVGAIGAGAVGATLDQLKDFETHQTILIYTNELTNVQTPVPEVVTKYEQIKLTSVIGGDNNNINDLNMTPVVLPGGAPVFGGTQTNLNTALLTENFNNLWDPDA